MKKDKELFSVIEFSAWQGFLIQRLITDSQRFITPSIDMDTLAEMEDKFHALLFQINLSDISVFPFENDISFSKICSSKLYILNKDLFNITKRNVHELLDKAGLPSLKAEKMGNPEEELFIKTNLNWGGELEKRFDDEFKKAIGYVATDKYISTSTGYYKTKRKKIPTDLWNRKDVVIETYVSNSEDKFLRLYSCGDSFVFVHAYSPHLIKKISNYPQDINIPFTIDDLESGNIDIPENLLNLVRKFNSKLEVDYYCLDIVYNDNLFFYVIDINTTPYITPMELPKGFSEFFKLGLERKILSHLVKKKKLATSMH